MAPVRLSQLCGLEYMQSAHTALHVCGLGSVDQFSMTYAVWSTNHGVCFPLLFLLEKIRIEESFRSNAHFEEKRFKYEMEMSCIIV